MSKIKELSPKEGIDLLFVEVPEGFYSHTVIKDVNGHWRVRTSDRVGNKVYSDPIVSEKEPVILGIATELSEEVVVDLLESFGDLVVRDDIRVWYDYENEELDPDISAEYSWASFLRLHGIGERWLVLITSKQ